MIPEGPPSSPPPEGNSPEVKPEFQIPDNLPEYFASGKQYENMLAKELELRQRDKEQRANQKPSPVEGLQRKPPYTEHAKFIDYAIGQIREQNRSLPPKEIVAKIDRFKKRMDYVGLAATRILDNRKQREMEQRRKDKKLPPPPPLMPIKKNKLANSDLP